MNDRIKSSNVYKNVVSDQIVFVPWLLTCNLSCIIHHSLTTVSFISDPLSCHWYEFNSVAPGRWVCSFKSIIFKLILGIDSNDGKSTSLLVMVWCYQAFTSAPVGAPLQWSCLVGSAVLTPLFQGTGKKYRILTPLFREHRILTKGSTRKK